MIFDNFVYLFVTDLSLNNEIAEKEATNFLTSSNYVDLFPILKISKASEKHINKLALKYNII